MTVVANAEGTATRVGWWLGQLVRATVGLLLLGGLLGAALGAAAPSTLSALSDDLNAGRVAEVVFADSSSFSPPTLRDADSHPVVRWKLVGGGWRVASAGEGSISPDPSQSVGSVDIAENAVRRQAEAAGVPVSLSGPVAPRRLIQAAMVVEVLLVLVLIGSPQPRYATKWAWFWVLLLPGGLGHLAWIAAEAPWSSRANRRPEPLPHGTQPDDRRLTGGRALVISTVLGILVAILAGPAAAWLAS
jgi:hypothetical protein